MQPTNFTPVRWADLHRQEFLERLAECPIVYLPLGLCEPHGHIAPFGLDTIKADYLCDEAASRFGGIVAPTMGYQIHETGPHAPWLKEVMEGENPRIGALPPHIMMQTFLYQLRAFSNAGFTGVVAISGHHGGAQADLRRVAEEFARDYPIAFFVCSDPELVEGRYLNDHAGKYEISQLLHIQPSAIKLDRAERMHSRAFGGRFAQNPDAHEATADYGRLITEASFAEIERQVKRIRATAPKEPLPFIPIKAMDTVWARIDANRTNWMTPD